jgi:ABC-2 type transport system ATP-binding protein
MLVAERLVKRFGDRTAVDGLSLAVAAGEIVGLLGPNGAGKSTTMLMLVGALVPDAGRVLVDGQVDPRRRHVRRRLGLAPQALALYPELTVEENVTFFARLHRVRGAVPPALELAGLADRRHERVERLSTGMMRRLNLAIALVHDPAVLLLDEPTAGVDPQSRAHLLDSVRALAARGRAVLCSTHDLAEAEALCQRVAIVDRGRLLALGRVDELVAAHGGPSRVVAELADGRVIASATHDPAGTVARLYAEGAAVAHLRVDRPDLEAVFLGLTGQALRDA